MLRDENTLVRKHVFSPPAWTATLGSALPARGSVREYLDGETSDQRLYEGWGHNSAVAPLTYSCSLRAFLRLRFRASASFARFFSPGFR